VNAWYLANEPDGADGDQSGGTSQNRILSKPGKPARRRATTLMGAADGYERFRNPWNI